MQDLIRWREDDRCVIRRRLAHSKSGHGDSHVDEENSWEIGISTVQNRLFFYNDVAFLLHMSRCREAWMR